MGGMSVTEHPARERLLILRARMAVAETKSPSESDLSAQVGVTATHALLEGSTSDAERIFRLRRAVEALHPERRAVRLDLLWRGSLIGSWRMTAGDLGLPMDPEAVVALKEQIQAFGSQLGKKAAKWTRYVNDKWPKFIGQVAAEAVRERFARHETLPYRVCDGLRDVLNAQIPDRKVIWLELEEPTGYLPLLNWEEMLRPHTGVPLLRLPYHSVATLSSHATVDVLMTCSVPKAEIALVGSAVVRSCRGILDATSLPHRCVVHLFADDASHGPVSKALRTANITILEPTDERERGVIVYPLPSRAVGLPREWSTKEADGVDHPWGSWVREALGGKTIDVLHVIGSGTLTSTGAFMVVAAQPVADEAVVAPASTKQSVRVRYVSAQQLREFGCQFGAWAILLATPATEDAQACRVVLNSVAKIGPMMLLGYDMSGTTESTTCKNCYRAMMADSVLVPSAVPTQRRDEVRVPDEPGIVLFLHPSRVLQGIDVVRMQKSHVTTVETNLEETFRAVRHALRRKMDEPGPSPTWMAVSQRHIEQSLSNVLEARVDSPFDRAAQLGNADALRIALQALNGSLNTDPTSSEEKAQATPDVPRVTGAE